MESWENCLKQATSDLNQASQAGFLGNNTWLKKTECSKFQVSGYNELWCTIIEVAISVDGLFKNILVQHLPDPL
jgi:hypothetical protein